MRKLLAIAFLTLAACGGGGGGGPATVETPVIAPAGGTFDATQSVTITCATAGAAIHYTIDGSAPAETSPTYSAALSVASTTTVKALATASGLTTSAVASATFTLQAKAPTLSLAPGTYATAQSVTLATTTAGAAIHYTIDGSTPTAASPAYTAAIPLPLGASAATTTIKAIATKAGLDDSPVASGTYVIDGSVTPTATPTFSPAAGTFTAAQSVTIASTTAGATISYCTGAGCTPATAYTGPVPVSASTTLRAVATAAGHSTSAVATAAYVINLPTAATPTFSPAGGSFTSAQSVTIASTTPGATITYCTGAACTPATAYTGAIPVSATTTLRAVANATGYLQSAVATASYTISSGGGGDFATKCAGYDSTILTLVQNCLHANPDLINSFNIGVACTDIQKEITAGLISYNSTQGATCLNDLQALTCATLSGQGNFGTPASCKAALVGTVANGGNCYSGNDCANGFCTADTALICPGKCQAFAALGADCSNADCADGQTCYFNGSGQVCAAQATTVGGPCPCGGALWCDTTAGSTCKAPLAAGASCTSGSQCSVGYGCFGTGPTCQALVGLNGACTPGSTAFAQTACGEGYICSVNTCVSWPHLSDACASTGFPPCLGSYCDVAASSPTCKAYVADGGACTASYQCSSSDCDTAGTHTCIKGSNFVCAMP